MLVCKRCANDLCGVGKPVMVADTRNCRMGAGLTRCEASQVQDKKSSVRVPECWPSACESDMSKKSYRELAVQRCSNILPWWWDHRLKFPALSDLARNRFWVMRINGASERVVWTARHVVNSRKVNLKSSSVNNILFFNGWLWRDLLKFWINFHKQRNMLHEILVVFKRTMAGTGRKQCEWGMHRLVGWIQGLKTGG